MAVTEAGIFSEHSEHPKKALSPMVFKPLGKTMFPIGTPLKAPLPISVSEADNLSEFKEEPPNARSPILVTVFGIFISAMS